MATELISETKTPPTDTRGKIVDALMELAAERRFEDISVRDISKAAGVFARRLSRRISFQGGRACGLHSPNRSHRSRARRWGAC